jgi:peptidoglycan/LPS O-acetylase OafA/YrhL
VAGQYFHKDWPYTLAQVATHYIPGIRDLMMSPRIDGVIWTLELEMKFYVVCALLIVWFRKHSLKVFLLPMALFAAAIWAGTALDALSQQNEALWRQANNFIFVAQHLIFLFIGVAFQYLYRGRLSALQAASWAAALFLLFCILWWCSGYRVEFESAINYVLAVFTVALAYRFRASFKPHRITDFLAGISYPLYVVHGIAGMVALRILIDLAVPVWLALSLIIASALVLAWLVHRTIEAPSIALSKKWSSPSERAP